MDLGQVSVISYGLLDKCGPKRLIARSGLRHINSSGPYDDLRSTMSYSFGHGFAGQSRCLEICMLDPPTFAELLSLQCFNSAQILDFRGWSLLHSQLSQAVVH